MSKIRANAKNSSNVAQTKTKESQYPLSAIGLAFQLQTSLSPKRTMLIAANVDVYILCSPIALAEAQHKTKKVAGFAHYKPLRAFSFCLLAPAIDITVSFCIL